MDDARGVYMFVAVSYRFGGKFGRIYVEQLIDSGSNFTSRTGTVNDRSGADGFCRILSVREDG